MSKKGKIVEQRKVLLQRNKVLLFANLYATKLTRSGTRENKRKNDVSGTSYEGSHDLEGVRNPIKQGWTVA